MFKTYICGSVAVNACISSPGSKEVEEGAAYGDLPTPTRNNYKFDGWILASGAGGTVSSSTTMGTSDVTLQAQWKIQYYVEFSGEWSYYQRFAVTQGDGSTAPRCAGNT